MKLFLSIIISLFFVVTIFNADDFDYLQIIIPFYLVCIMLLRLMFIKKVQVDFFNVVFFGFLYFIYTDVTAFSNTFSYDIELEAAKLIVIAFFILMSVLLVSSNNGRYHSYAGEFSFATSNKLKVATVFLFCLFAIYCFIMLPIAAYSYRFGRGAIYINSIGGHYLPYLNALSYIIPGFFAILYKKKAVSLKVAVVFSIVVFFIQIMMGTRFVFLFSFFIFISILVDLKNFKLSKVTPILITLLLVSSIMGALRGGGNENSSLNAETVISRLSHSEGLKYYFSGLVKYYKFNDHSYIPVQSLFFSYFYIPRSVWDDKPQIIGRWIIDSGVFNVSYGSGHSGSLTFFAPFYSDFGVAGLFFVFLIGWVLLYVELFYFKFLGRPDLNGIISASILPTIFFGLRSFNTSMITFITIFVVCMALKILGKALDGKNV